MNQTQAIGTLKDQLEALRADWQESPHVQYIKTRLLLTINEACKRKKLSPARAAAVMRLSEPEALPLFQGQLRQYSIEQLITCLAAVNPNVRFMLIVSSSESLSGNA
jgi:predicted XRE-type DNA-binding protein